MKHLVLGMGQIGTAIYKVLKEGYQDVHGLDPLYNDVGDFIHMEQIAVDVLHICFPYMDKFINEVWDYQTRFLGGGGLTIIHSTVPLGVSNVCNAVHSPVRGIHPNLYLGVKQFTKFFGGSRATDAAAIFSKIGIDVEVTKSAESTEAMKLIDTLVYGLNIVIEKEIHSWCETNGVDFDIVYTKANQSYNDGYMMLGHPEYQKYVLKHTEGEIGGHCVIPNANLTNFWMARLLVEINKMYQYENSDI